MRAWKAQCPLWSVNLPTLPSLLPTPSSLVLAGAQLLLGQKRSSQQRPARHSPLLSTPGMPSLSLLIADPSVLPVKAVSPSGHRVYPFLGKIIQQATRPLATHIINVPSLSQLPSSIQHVLLLPLCYFKTKTSRPYASLHLYSPEQNPSKGVCTGL